MEVLSSNPTSKILNFGGIAILVLVEASIVSQHPQKLAETLVLTLVAVGAWLSWLTPIGGGKGVRLWQVACMGASAVGLAVSSSQGAAIIPAVVAIVASTRLQKRVGLAFVIVLIGAFLIAVGIALGWAPISLFSYGLGLTFAYLAARSNNELREEQSRTKALLHELQQNRDAQIQAAAINERARIAREIHDVLAHTLAALSVQLENARVILNRHASDREAAAAVERAHHLAREGLNETRRAVSALRGEQIPGPDELKQLVEGFQRDTGISASLRVDGTARPLGAESQLALYRTAQEALTNIRKHASPQRVEVLVRYQPSSTELLVSDHGEKAARAAANGGYGLIGMRERAELLGGTLDARSTEDGFLVTLNLPG
jgi:signal transduction histidine kinase